MTNIYLNKAKNGKIEMMISGHSGYAAAGADIVCAAVSMLSHSFCNLCAKLETEHKITIDRFEIKDGYLGISISDPTSFSKAAYDMLQIGFEDLEENYPENVKLLSEWGEKEKLNM